MVPSAKGGQAAQRRAAAKTVDHGWQYPELHAIVTSISALSL